jgi:hypothetical protein
MFNLRKICQQPLLRFGPLRKTGAIKVWNDVRPPLDDAVGGSSASNMRRKLRWG